MIFADLNRGTPEKTNSSHYINRRNGFYRQYNERDQQMAYHIKNGQSCFDINLDATVMYVSSGGYARGIAVNTWGSMFVVGGSAEHTQVNRAGVLHISSGGTANSTTVNSNGDVHISSGSAKVTISGRAALSDTASLWDVLALIAFDPEDYSVDLSVRITLDSGETRVVSKKNMPVAALLKLI